MRATFAVLGFPGKTDLLRASLGDPQSPHTFTTTVNVSGVPFSLTLLDLDHPDFSDAAGVIFIYDFNDQATFLALADLATAASSFRASSPRRPAFALLGHLFSQTGDRVSQNSVSSFASQFSVDFSSDICPATFGYALTKLVELSFSPIGEFTGKTVVITGGAQGIGKCLCLEFAKRGALVFAADIDEAALAALEAEARAFSGRVRAVPCDVAIEADCRRLAEAASAGGAIDVLVNDAGIGRFNDANIFDPAMDGFDRVIAVNLRGTFMCAKFCSVHMSAGSAIVNIASSRATQSEPKTEGYSASKGGIVALTHAMSMSLAPKGVRVNAVSPGWIDVSTWRPGGEQEKFTPEDLAQHPVGRVGVPQDIAEICIFLASPRAGFITGQNHVVDGGMTKKMIYV
jgi:NAD(P)-dependent dehydrogenase (short-subunit alcohol dehydrogenase family)